MLLAGKNAIVYGAAGSIGAAVARSFAREGATVHLAGRTAQPLERLAAKIRESGGTAEMALVDALDEMAVDEHADAVAARGGIDISVNLISLGDVQGTPLVDLSLADFELPVTTATRTVFLTSRAAARHMIKKRSGVILTFGGADDPTRGGRDHNLGGFQVALGAIDALRRQLAVELGRYGIRVVTILSGGVPDTLADEFGATSDVLDGIVDATLLNRAETLDDVADVVTFVASDRARMITATSINMTGGAVVN